MKSDAAELGVSKRAINVALAGVTYDKKVIGLDRNQKHLRPELRAILRAHDPAADGPREVAAREIRDDARRRSRMQFGVPGAVVVAIWGLETDFGAVAGQPSVASLARDARPRLPALGFLPRPADRRDPHRRARRSLAGADGRRLDGELGQTQFLPSSYMAFAVDFDGNGKRDLLKSPADVLASTANYLRGHGWKAGEPWTPGTAELHVSSSVEQVATSIRAAVAEFARRLARGEASAGLLPRERVGRRR